MNCSIKFFSVIKYMFVQILGCLLADVYFGKHMSGVPDGSMVFFPCRDNVLCCGLTGIVSFKKKNKTDSRIDITSLKDMLKKVKIFAIQTAGKMT